MPFWIYSASLWQHCLSAIYRIWQGGWENPALLSLCRQAVVWRQAALSDTKASVNERGVERATRYTSVSNDVKVTLAIIGPSQVRITGASGWKDSNGGRFLCKWSRWRHAWQPCWTDVLVCYLEGEKIIKKIWWIDSIEDTFFLKSNTKNSWRVHSCLCWETRFFFLFPWNRISIRKFPITLLSDTSATCWWSAGSPPRLFTLLNGPDSNFCHQFLTSVSCRDWHNERRQKRERIINQMSWISSCHLVQEKNDERRQCYAITCFSQLFILKYTIHLST